MTNKGIYTGFNGETMEYGYEAKISLSQKANFVMEVAGMVVSSEIGYAYILKDTIYNYCLIKYYTDIELFAKPEDFSLDMVDAFCMNNKESVINAVVDAIGKTDCSELVKACDEAIEYRKLHYDDYKEEISILVMSIKALIEKPDQLNELLISLTKAVDTFAEESNIDMDVVNKFVSIIPVMKDMGSVEVAKTIVENFHDNDKLVTQNKSNKSNMEVVK